MTFAEKLVALCHESEALDATLAVAKKLLQLIAKAIVVVDDQRLSKTSLLACLAQVKTAVAKKLLLATILAKQTC